jgi:4-oxalocrotonate tautomerase
MPTLEVFLPPGHADSRKAELIESLTDAVCRSIGAPVEAVRILLSEVPFTDFGLGGRTAADGAPPRLLTILAILIAGRTGDQKRALIAALSEAGARVLDTPLQEARIVIKDIPNTDFGIGGKTARELGR